MTDQELIAYLKLQGLDKDVAAADRIEELVKERDDLQRRCTNAEAAILPLSDERDAAEAKLTKAVEALQAAKVYIADLQDHEGAEGFSASTNQAADNYYAALAELKGKDHG